MRILLDLNPSSHFSLVHNAKRNGCVLTDTSCSDSELSKKRQRPQHANVSKAALNEAFVTRNLDGRDFIIELTEKGVYPHEVIMNLPANATDFLDVFIGLQTRHANHHSLPSRPALPRIHVYGFSNAAADPIGDLAIRYSAFR
jgi:hypothetical protein